MPLGLAFLRRNLQRIVARLQIADDESTILRHGYVQAPFDQAQAHILKRFLAAHCATDHPELIQLFAIVKLLTGGVRHLAETQVSCLHQRPCDLLIGIQGQSDDTGDDDPQLVVQRAPDIRRRTELLESGDLDRNRHRLVLQALRQQVFGHVRVTVKRHQRTRQQAVLVLGFGCPGGDHVAQVQSQRLALPGVGPIPVFLYFPVCLTQGVVLAQIVQEQVQRGLGQPGRPLAYGLVELDIHFTVLDRQFADEQLP